MLENRTGGLEHSNYIKLPTNLTPTIIKQSNQPLNLSDSSSDEETIANVKNICAEPPKPSTEKNLASNKSQNAGESSASARLNNKFGKKGMSCDEKYERKEDLQMASQLESLAMSYNTISDQARVTQSTVHDLGSALNKNQRYESHSDTKGIKTSKLEQNCLLTSINKSTKKQKHFS